jgi:hypothetical protein
VLGGKVDYPVGAGTLPYSIALGDLNGEGGPDVAVADFKAAAVSVLPGLAAGTLGPAVMYGAGHKPSSVALGDLSGDGLLDVAVANVNSNVVSVLLGQSGGAFGTATNYGTGARPFGVATGDMDADGDLDLVTANDLSGSVSVSLNLTQRPNPWTDLGLGLAGVLGVPALVGSGTLETGSAGQLALSSAAPLAPALLVISLSSAPISVKCGTLVAFPFAALLPIVTDGAGSATLSWDDWPAGLSGMPLYFQDMISDPAAACGVSFSNALRADVP